MATKDEFDFEDFDMEDIGNDDPMGEGASPAKDRNPVSSVTSGALTGIRNSIKNPSFYRGALKEALPASYGTTFNAVDDITSEGIGLYNSLRDDLRPATRQLKRSMRTVQKSVAAITPDWISKKLDQLLADDSRPEHAGPTQEEIQDTAIAGELGAIFKLQAETSADAKADGLMQDAINTKRHATNVDLNQTIVEHLARLTGYQDQIGSAFQRKSLELQFRSFYATRELLEVTKATTEESIVLLRSVVKNTALPEYQKIEASEAMGELARNRLFGMMQDSAHNSLRPFLRQSAQRLRINLGGKIREAMDSFNSGAEMAETMNDQLEFARENGQDPNELIGELAGESLMNAGARKLGSKFRPHLEKNKKIVGAGLASGNFFRTLVGRLQDWSTSNTDSFGIGGEIINLLKNSFAPQMEEKIIAQDRSADLNKQAMFTNRAHVTLVDIIPGLLSRQLQSLEGIRTGELPDLTLWDHGSGEFISRTNMASKILRSVFKKEDVEQVTSRGKTLVDSLEVKASDEDRAKMVNALVEKSKRERYFNPDKFGTPSFYAGLLDEKLARKLAAAIRSKTGVNQSGNTDIENVSGLKATQGFISEWANMRTLNTGNGAENAAKHFNSGYQDIVRQLGISNNQQGTEHYDTNYLNSRLDGYRKNGEDYEKTIKKILVDGNMVHNAANAGPNRPIVNPNNQNPTSAAPTVATPEPQATQTPHQREAANVNLTEVMSQIGMVGDKVEMWSSRTAVEESLTWLERILMAIQAQGSGEGYSGDGGGNPSGPNKPGLFRRGLRGIRNGAKWARGKWWGGTKSIYGAAWKLAKAPFQAAKWLFNRNRIEDVYVAGNTEPVLTQAGFLAGEYFDSITGKVITSIKDIKGSVKNRAGDIVLSHEQFLTGMYNKLGKKIDLGRGWMREHLGKLGSLATLPFKPLKIGLNILNSARKLGADLLFDTPDIYVPGESTPRILSRLLRTGQHYYVGMKAISRVGQIRGDVLDRNGKVVLSLEEFARGVVDHTGAPLKTTIDTLKGIATLPWRAAKGAWGLAKAGFRKGVDLAKGGFNALRNGISGGLSANVGTNQKSILIRIHNMMVEKWGIGTPIEGDNIVNRVKSVFNKLTKRIDVDRAKTTASDIATKARENIDKFRAKHNLERSDLDKHVDSAKGQFGSLKDRVGGGLKGMFRKKMISKNDTRDADGDGDVDLDDMASFITGKKLNRRKSIKERVNERLSEDRKGSWREILAKRAQAAKDKLPKKSKKKVAGGSGWMPKIWGLLTGALSIFGGMWTSIKGMASTLLGIKAATAAGGILDAVGDIAGGGKKGIMRRVAGGVGRGIGAMAKGAWALTGGALGLVGRAALWAGGAAASVLSAPVVLGAAAVAAVGVGGYYAYKYFAGKLTPSQQLRMAQYGIPESEKDFQSQTGEVEHLLTGSVVWDGDRAIKVNLDQKLLRKIVNLYGVDEYNVDAIKKLELWLHRRFLPVYLTALTALKSVDPKASLVSAHETLKPKQQLTFIKRSMLDESHSAYMFTGPVTEDVTISGGYDTVNGFFIQAKEALNQATTTTVNKDAEMAIARAGQIRKHQNDISKMRVEAEMAKLNLIKNKTDTPKITDIGKGTTFSGTKMNSILAGRPGFNGEQVTIKPVGSGSVLQGGVINTHGTPIDPNGAYANIPVPSGNGRDRMRETIVAAANVVGVNPALTMALAEMESSYQANAKAGTSSAKGLFQFIDNTWSGMMRKYAKTYGIPTNATATDPVAASLMGAKLLKDGTTALESSGIKVGATEAYLNHFMGTTGAKKFLSADGATIAAGLMPSAAKANPSIFYRDGRPTTVGEVYTYFENKVNKGITGSGVQTTVSTESESNVKDEQWIGGRTTTPGMSATERLLAAGTTPTAEFERVKANKLADNYSTVEYPTVETPRGSVGPSSNPVEQSVAVNSQDRTASVTEVKKMSALEARVQQSQQRNQQASQLASAQQQSLSNIAGLSKSTIEISTTLKESLAEQRETNKLLSSIMLANNKPPVADQSSPSAATAANTRTERQRYVNNAPQVPISTTRKTLG